MKKLTKNQKIGIGIGTGVIGIFAIAKIVKSSKRKKETQIFDPINDAPVLDIPAGKSINQSVQYISFPLKKGDKNDAVRRFQNFVNKNIAMLQMKVGFALQKLQEDSVFGDKTETAANLLFKEPTVSKSNFENYKM